MNRDWNSGAQHLEKVNENGKEIENELKLFIYIFWKFLFSSTCERSC